MSLDDIDVKILEVLQANARVSMSEISKRVSLSLSAVSERLKKLENSGVVEQYTAILSSRAMKKELSVIMMISLANQAKKANSEEFLRFVEQSDEILECCYITGEYDYVLKIITKNTSTLEILMNTIKGMSCINRTQTNVILNDVKKLYSVAPVAQE
jgi:Lrp/AsnC family leucine-responsive transcriptional regulator